LNAIGTEPELTLSLLPSAHAILFVLAADTGVTKTDLEVWNRFLAGDDAAQRAGRLVILNKIDSLWDELKPAPAIAAEIDRQVDDRGDAWRNVIAGSRGIGAEGPDRQSQRRRRAPRESRLPALEDALSGKLIPAKRRIVGAATQAEVSSLVTGVRTLLEARQTNIAEQLAELRAARQEPGRRRA
jgi:hypothetical protein